MLQPMTSMVNGVTGLTVQAPQLAVGQTSFIVVAAAQACTAPT